MKRLLMMLTLAIANQAFAYTGFGICNFGKETVPSVVCYGPAVLKDTTVSADLKVSGQLTAVNISAGSLAINGATDIQNSKVTGAVEIIGNLNASNVNFQQGVLVTATTILLHNVKVKGDVVVTSTSDTPYITLECGTIISGIVKFIGRAGVIKITGDSAIQGKITNGSMIFEKRKC